jgi:hypothetical protein
MRRVKEHTTQPKHSVQLASACHDVTSLTPNPEGLMCRVKPSSTCSERRSLGMMIATVTRKNCRCTVAFTFPSWFLLDNEKIYLLAAAILYQGRDVGDALLL